MAINDLHIYGLPTERDVFALMEAAAKKETTADKEKFVDPFWFPGQKKLGSGPYTVNNMQGAVKVPKADLQGKRNVFTEDMLTDWQTILRKLKDKSKTAKTATPKIDSFGTVTVNVNGKTMSPEQLASQLKALRKTSVTEHGHTTTTVEELGVPVKEKVTANKLHDNSGAVQVKNPSAAEWGNNKEKKLDFFNQSNVQTHTTDGKVITGEFPANKPVKLHDNSGAVKVPKAKL